MNSNRLNSDICAVKQSLKQSTAPTSLIMDPFKYNHCNTCFPEFGILGGTAVSHVSGNLVELENDLSGRNRPVTRCPQYKYMPNHAAGYVKGKNYIKPSGNETVDTSMRHLKPCNFTTFHPLPSEPLMDVYRCPARPKKIYV